MPDHQRRCRRRLILEGGGQRLHPFVIPAELLGLHKSMPRQAMNTTLHQDKAELGILILKPLERIRALFRPCGSCPGACG